MPPRRFENHTPEPEHRYRPHFSEEENKEEPKEKTPKQKLKPEEKKLEKKSEQAKKEPPKREEKSRKKELSPEEKQERRSEAVERSQALRKQFEETPLPSDPSTVARLIVAKHILSIDEQLQDPEVLDGVHAQKKLEATLDFMCDLAEKLEDPTIESPPHIQDAYETLLELTEEALEAADAPKELTDEITTINPPEQQPSQTLPAATLSPTARNLLAYLHLASSQPSIAWSVGHQSPDSNNLPASPPYSVPGTDYKRPFSHIAKNSTQEMLSTHPRVHDAREFHLAMQPNIAKPLAVVALASTVASAIHRTPDISHRHEATATATPNHSTVQPTHIKKSDHSKTPVSRLEKPASYAPSASTPETPGHEILTSISREPHSHHYAPEATSPNRKLEHMSLPSLLSLAQDVHLGHGRYLRDEFEHGRIDKDGLVKVLKARKKGLNFAQEFNTQTANFKQRLQSIEFITKPPKPTHSNENPDQIPIITALADSQPKEPKDSQKEAFTHPILEHYAHPEESFFQVPGKNPVPINLIVTILTIIIFGSLIFFLFLPV